MINTIKTSPVGLAWSLWKQGDPSLYGTLWVIAACLGALATLLLPG
jgi:hypothetical protein